MEAELLAAGDAAAGDCWSLPGLCADMFTSPAAAGLGGGGPGGPTAAARRTAGGTRFEACGTVAKSAEASYSPSECNFGARFAANLQMEGRKRTGLLWTGRAGAEHAPAEMGVNIHVSKPRGARDGALT